MINPIFLKTFIDLCETRSFTATSKKLHMTQPGVSKHIKWLEEYFEISLIYRKGKIFEVTDAGFKVLKHAKELQFLHENFLFEVKDDNPHRGTCRFASPGSFGIQMYSFLLNLNKSHSGLSIHYSYAPNQSIIENILDDNLDIGFVNIKPNHPSIDYRLFEKEKLCLVTPKKIKDCSFDELNRIGFINHPDGFHQASRLLSENFPGEFKSTNDLKVSGFNNQINRILEPVSLGLGFTVLPEFACRSFPKQRQLNYVKLKKDITDPIYKIFKKNRNLPMRFKFIFNKYDEFKKE